jgi:hypothetical protein
MIEELKRVKYTCDCCGAHVIEERLASEVNDLPHGWEEYLHFRGEARRECCELAMCQFQCSQWAR